MDQGWKRIPDKNNANLNDIRYGKSSSQVTIFLHIQQKKKIKKKLGNEKVELFFIVLQQHKDVHETLQRACNHI
jgi:hypothetical protein